MQFSFESPLSFPRPRVFEVLHHELPELVPLLPNIDRVELIREGTDDAGHPTSLHHWFASPGMAPALIRPFVSKAMTQWLDHGVWDDRNWTIGWRFESPSVRDMYHCGGTHCLLAPTPDACTLVFAGELAIDPAKVPGVPQLLTRKAAPVIERFLLDLILRNLKHLPGAVERYLGQRG